MAWRQENPSLDPFALAPKPWLLPVLFAWLAGGGCDEGSPLREAARICAKRPRGLRSPHPSQHHPGRDAERGVAGAMRWGRRPGRRIWLPVFLATNVLACLPAWIPPLHAMMRTRDNAEHSSCMWAASVG